jgi:amino acid adenylation domain-containing protein
MNCGGIGGGVDSTDQTITALLEQTWSTSPSSVALADAQRSLDRAQLAARVRQLADELAAAGVRPGDIAAVYVERSVDLVLAQLAVLFAGAAHVAVDPDDPQSRLEYILDDCRPALVVCSRSLAHRVPQRHRSYVVDGGATGGDGGGVRPRSGDIKGSDGAYLIYTSGTTGAPKASLITHAGLSSRLRWLQTFCPMEPSDVVLYKTACGFDVSVAELYWPLTAGGTLFCARPGVQRDTDYLAEVLVQQGVTILHFVPSLLDLFLASRPDQERYDSVRYLLAGGEALSPELVRRWQARSTGTLLNMYGPSECSVYTTAWKCPQPLGDQRVLIGEAVADTGLWVLDADGNQVLAPDQPGELYVSGVGLSRGYLGRSELTAAKFRNLAEINPQLPALRAYRTGDVVAWAEPGQLEFRGRADRQVKVRGYRIEPDEIEAVAAAVPGVTRAAVVARRGDDATELLLFVVAQRDDPTAGTADLVATVRESLQSRLPPYMQPRQVVVVDALPLTPNGKRDDAALLALAVEADGSATESLAAAQLSPLERTWSTVLNTQVTPDSDFFLAGGDSFLGVRLIKEISQAAGQRVPIRLLFANPVLADFRRELERYLSAGTGET